MYITHASSVFLGPFWLLPWYIQQRTLFRYLHADPNRSGPHHSILLRCVSLIHCFCRTHWYICAYRLVSLLLGSPPLQRQSSFMTRCFFDLTHPRVRFLPLFVKAKSISVSCKSKHWSNGLSPTISIVSFLSSTFTIGDKSEHQHTENLPHGASSHAILFLHCKRKLCRNTNKIMQF